MKVLLGDELFLFTLLTRGHQHGARGHQVTYEVHVGHQRACSKNSVGMISIFTEMNIVDCNNNVMKGKLSKLFISEVHLNRYSKSSPQFQKGW